MTFGTIDYTLSYFKYKTLIPVCRELTNKVLKHLKLELQINASLVETN